MKKTNNYKFLMNDLSSLKGVGYKTVKILKKKKINNVFDLLWKLPKSFIDRSVLSKVNELQIGKIHTIKIIPIKYNFPRIRNLPNKVFCEDETGKIDCIFFNSYEGYIRKILPLNQEVTVSGKIGYFKKKYQITNPTYVSNNPSLVRTVHNKYSLTEGITEKMYNKILDQVLSNLPTIAEWLDQKILKKFDNISWSEAIKKLHKPENIGNYNSNFYKRLSFDEILSSFLIFSEVRKKIKKIKKNKKTFTSKLYENIMDRLGFNLTNDQINVLKEINNDLSSQSKMFRLLQGDVGSGKTIVSLLSSLNVIESGYQVAFMAPTEILALQHFDNFKKFFGDQNVNVEIVTSKIHQKKRKIVLDNIQNGKINFIIGTHALFQEKIKFKNLGYIIIDEQHKFGVKQRIELASKGDVNTDVLLMTATPIPRTLIITNYGDMDLSTISERPFANNISTFLKPNDKISEVLKFIEGRIKDLDQVFWVCPIIEESDKIKVKAVSERLEYLKNNTTYKIDCMHGNLNEQDRVQILSNFLNNKLNLIVCTTIVEVGIDNPNVNTIIIENSERFGLSQLHQLRGRVGRSGSKANCILIYNKNLSELSKKRLKIIKDNTDGFLIAEEDLKLRGYGDILGFKQSGEKDFLIADPLYHSHLFDLAKEYIDQINDTERFSMLLKIFNKQKIFNIIDAG